MSKHPPRVVLLAGPGRETRIVYHALSRRVDLRGVILEPGQPTTKLLRRRLRRLGPRTVAGQVLFRALLSPLLYLEGRHRIEEILGSQGLHDGPMDSSKVIGVPSVNHDEARRALCRLRPDVVVIQGTTIVKPETLNCVEAPFVNTHTGITPNYRGVHGGYWSLHNDEIHRFGVTVHLVDEGIDTGAVLARTTCWPTHRDNYASYPYLQLAAGVPLLVDTVVDLYEGRAEPEVPASKTSMLWSHPTAMGYLAGRVFRGVR